jgi:hypothetical protein
MCELITVTNFFPHSLDHILASRPHMNVPPNTDERDDFYD